MKKKFRQIKSKQNSTEQNVNKKYTYVPVATGENLA